MSKISLIILGLVLLVCLTAAAREEEEELSSLREAREAAPGRKGAGRRGKNNSRRGKNNSRRGKNNSRRGKNNARRGKNNARQSGRTITETCFEQSITIMKMWKDVISNFEKQKKRMVKQNETAEKKAGKKSQFGPIGQMLVEAGGGNKSALSCGGSTTNDGAKQLKNLTDTLDACKDDINAVCDPANIPQPNMTFIMMCDDLVTQFKTGAQECLGKTLGVNKTDATEACSCWTNPGLDAVVQQAKMCKASDEAKAIAAALKKCTSAFGKCRKFEDDANTAISACSSDTSKLTAKATTLTANSAAVTAAKDKVASLASSNSTRRLVRAASISTCAEVIIYAGKLAAMAEAFPASPEITVTAGLIIAVTDVNCTAAEITSLVSAEASLVEAVATVEIALEAVQDQLMTLTGSTLPSAVAGTTVAGTPAPAPVTLSTTAPSGRIRNFKFV